MLQSFDKWFTEIVTRSKWTLCFGMRQVPLSSMFEGVKLFHCWNYFADLFIKIIPIAAMSTAICTLGFGKWSWQPLSESAVAIFRAMKRNRLSEPLGIESWSANKDQAHNNYIYFFYHTNCIHVQISAVQDQTKPSLANRRVRSMRSATLCVDAT